MKKTNKEVAREVVLGYLLSIASKTEMPNLETLNERFLIQKDDKVLLEHIKILKKIFEKAIEEIENESK